MHGGNSLVALEGQAPIQLGSQCDRVRRPIEMKLYGYAAKTGRWGRVFCQWAETASDNALLRMREHVDCPYERVHTRMREHVDCPYERVHTRKLEATRIEFEFILEGVCVPP